MNWLSALLLLAVVALARTSSKNVNWEYAQPWRPLHDPCPSCKKESRSLGEDMEISESTNSVVKVNQLTFEHLKPGVPTRLSPDGSTTIVKMVMEKFKTPNNSSVQLVYIPSGHLANFTDKGWATMVTAESNPTPSTVLQAPLSMKQKRDHRTRSTSTNNRKTFPMTLIAAEGKQAAAREQLQLLEAALSSPEATRSNNGELPRVFIAPSNIPPPPGYVKIPLVPQKQTHSAHNKLPPTFLTHSNPKPLPPGFVRLSLPPSVSHLSQEIPLVKPEKLPRPFSSNTISAVSLKKLPGRESLVPNNSVPPPPPIFDARGNSVADSNQHVISSERFNIPQASLRPQPQGNRNNIQTAHFSQPEIRLQEDHRSESRNERTPNPAIQQIPHFSIPQHSRPGLASQRHSPARENLFKNQNSNKLHTPLLSDGQQQQNSFVHAPNSGLQSDINDPRFLVKTNLSPGNFEHQLRLQTFNQNAVRQHLSSSGGVRSSSLSPKPLEPLGSNFDVTVSPAVNSDGFLRQSQEQHNQGKFAHDNRSPVSAEKSRPTPEAIRLNNEGPRSFVNQNIAHLGIKSRDQFQSQAPVSSKEKSQPANPLFRPLPIAVNSQQIQSLVDGNDRRNRVQKTSINPPQHSNDDDQSVHFPPTKSVNLQLIPAKGIQVVSKGEPKPLIENRPQTSATPVVKNFINPQTFVQPSAERLRPSDRAQQIPHANILSNIGTPATVSFRTREQERNEVTGIPPPHDPRFDEMIKKQERESALVKEKNQSPEIVQNENIRPFNSIAAVPQVGISTRVQLHSNVRVNNQVGRQPQPSQSSRPRNEEPSVNEVPIRVTSFPPVSARPTFPHPTTPQILPSPLTTVTPRITTFSPPHRFRFPTTTFSPFSSTTPTPVTSSAFSPPLFSRPFSSSFPSSFSPVPSTTPLFEHDNSEFGRQRETISEPFTGRPFTSSENQAFSAESPALSSTVRAVSQHPRFEANHDSTPIFTSTPRTFSSTGGFHSSNSANSFEFSTEVPSSEVRTVGPFKVQPFFNSFAFPQAPSSSFELTQSDLTPKEQFEKARDAAVRPFLSSTTPSPTSFAPFVTSTQRNDQPFVTPFSNEQHSERFQPPRQSFSEVLPAFSGRLPVPQHQIPFNQPPIFNHEQFSRFNSGKVFPTPQKIDVPQNNFIEIKEDEENTVQDTNDDVDTSFNFEITTTQPEFSITTARSTQRVTTSIVPSTAVQTEASNLRSAERQEETTLFPPFSVVRKRQRLNKIKVDPKKDTTDDDPSKKTHPLVFGRRLRPRFRPASNSDQTQSGSKPRVISRIVTTTSPSNSRSRLNISSRFRERSRSRVTTTSTSSTTESTSAFSDGLTPAEEVPESALTPVEVGLIQKTVSKSTVRGDINLQKRERLPAGQRRRRPGGRRVPEWVRERRRRLRKKLTTEAPNLQDTAIDDPPADFIDDNAFSLAESARVTFTHPRENSPTHIETPVTEISPTPDETDTVTEAEDVHDEFEDVGFDVATTEAVLHAEEDETRKVTTESTIVSPATFLKSVDEPLGSEKEQDLKRDDAPRFPIGRRIVPPLTRTYVNAGKYPTDDFDTEKITLLETSKYGGRFPTMQLPTAVQAHLPRRHNSQQLPPTLDRSFPQRYRITRPLINTNKQSSSEILTEKNTQPYEEFADEIPSFEDSTDEPTTGIDGPFFHVKSLSDIDLGPNVDFISTRVSHASSTERNPTSLHSDDSSQNPPKLDDEQARLTGEDPNSVTHEFSKQLGISSAFDSQRVKISDYDNADNAHNNNPPILPRPANGLVDFGKRSEAEKEDDENSNSYSLTEPAKPNSDLDDHVEISFPGGPDSNVDEARRTFEYSEYEDDGEAIAESRRHVIYAQAPSKIAEIYENVDETTLEYGQIEEIETITISSNDEQATDGALASSELFRTVADGFKKAEETQIAADDDSLSVTDSPMPDVSLPTSTMSTFEEIESLLRSQPQSVEKKELLGSENPAANLAGKEGTVIGYSTVLEIRSSEPKVCFSNGRCIPAKHSTRR